MNSISSAYQSTARKDLKGVLIVAGVVLGLVGGVLFLQSLTFVSSLRVLWEFGYGEWGVYLRSMLGSLATWAGLTGALFAVQFAATAKPADLRGLLQALVTGFITGFAFVYGIVLVLAILIFLPLGIVSIFDREIIRYATLAFSLLAGAYLVFIWIAIDTPSLLLDVIQTGNWYFKLLALLGGLLLATQILRAVLGLLRILVHESAWQFSFTAFLLAVGGSLLLSIVMILWLVRPGNRVQLVFAIVLVYVASIVTGGSLGRVFHWGELQSAFAAGIVAPVAYSFLAKLLIRHPFSAVAHLVGLVPGSLLGLLIDRMTGLRIIGQGWFGLLCGTGITLAFGVGFGLILGPALANLLVRWRIQPFIAFWLGAGLFVGIVLGMVAGGFAAR